MSSNDWKGPALTLQPFLWTVATRFGASGWRNVPRTACALQSQIELLHDLCAGLKSQVVIKSEVFLQPFFLSPGEG